MPSGAELEAQLASLRGEQEALVFGTEAPGCEGFLGHIRFLRSQYLEAVQVLRTIDPADAIGIATQQQRANQLDAEIDYFENASKRAEAVSSQIAAVQNRLKLLKKEEDQPGEFIPPEIEREDRHARRDYANDTDDDT